MFSDHSRRRALSLTELLVGVAVASVLMALSLPVLLRLRTKGNSAKCSGTLRQWGMAFQLYANENNMKLPTAPGSPVWQELVASRLVTGKAGQLRFELRKFTCPNDKKQYDSWGYGLNLWLKPDYYPQAPRKITDIQSPSRFVILVDSEASGVSSATAASPPAKVSGVFYDRHGGSANFLFADMHIKFLTAREAREKSLDSELIFKQ